MPTGYTAAVKDGISFEQFTWSCARAFGALMLMRDEPSDAPIPEAFKPSDFYSKCLEKAESRLAALKAMTPEEAQAAAAASYAQVAKQIDDHKAEAQELRNKYSEMLAKVDQWAPPTPEHQGLKDFMAEQLRQSIDFDCSTSYLTEPVQKDGPTWLAESIADAEHQIKRYLEQHAEEVTRTEQRNAWIKALRESVPPPSA